jgi:hypothetical protein
VMTAMPIQSEVAAIRQHEDRQQRGDDRTQAMKAPAARRRAAPRRSCRGPATPRRSARPDRSPGQSSVRGAASRRSARK